MRKGAWQILVPVVALVLVAGLTTVVRAHLSGSAAADVGPGYAANRAAAKAEGDRLLGLLPVPAGASRSADSPIPSLARGYAGEGPSDTSLIRTAWWTVPEPGYVVAAWFNSHRPAGLAPSNGSGTSVADDGASVGSIDWAGTGTMAYTGPVVIAEWTAMPGGTAVRADVYNGAREPRTPAMQIPDDVTEVVITRTTTPTVGDHPQSRTVQRRVSEPAESARLVKALNTAPGAAITDTISTGHPVKAVVTYGIQITWPGHTMLGAVENDGPLTLTLDGHRLAPDLDPGYDFPALLDQLMQQP